MEWGIAELGYNSHRRTRVKHTVRILSLVAVAAAFASPVSVAASIVYTCSMSGEISTSCCCGPVSGDGCVSIGRPCGCCDVSLIERTEAPAQAVAVNNCPPAAHTSDAPIPVGAMPPDTWVSTRMLVDRARARSAPFYILNSALLR